MIWDVVKICPVSRERFQDILSRKKTVLFGIVREREDVVELNVEELFACKIVLINFYIVWDLHLLSNPCVTPSEPQVEIEIYCNIMHITSNKWSQWCRESKISIFSLLWTAFDLILTHLETFFQPMLIVITRWKLTISHNYTTTNTNVINANIFQ